jgi:hypothetical protein
LVATLQGRTPDTDWLFVLREVNDAATVKKHLERVYEKLGVETRTAAAAMAMQKVREFNLA